MPKNGGKGKTHGVFSYKSKPLKVTISLKFAGANNSFVTFD